jgi:Tfp pilus assembly protein PilN
MKAPNELSFLPEDYLERKAQRRTNAICATLFLIVMVCIGSAFTFTERSMRAVEAEHAELEKQYTEAAKRIQQVNQMQEKQRTMAIQAELTSSLLEKVPRSNLLAEITNKLPRGVSLLDLSLESKRRQPPREATPKSAFEQKRSATSGTRKAAGAAGGKDGSASAGGAAPPEPRVYDVSVKITGIAYTDVQVGEFITQLNTSQLFKDVNLVISDEFRTPDQEALRKFQIEMMINPAADVNAVERPKFTAVELQPTK